MDYDTFTSDDSLGVIQVDLLEESPLALTDPESNQRDHELTTGHLVFSLSWTPLAATVRKHTGFMFDTPSLPIFDKAARERLVNSLPRFDKALNKGFKKMTRASMMPLRSSSFNFRA